MSKIRLSRLDMKSKISGEGEYEAELARLQLKMLTIQQHYFHARRRAVIVFEGWDAAGKGGCIRRLSEKLDPRGLRVWPIGIPQPDDQARHYLYRFWMRLPEPGVLAVFDRSWYGRVLVERVEGLVQRPRWKRAYDEINAFERMLTDDGVRVVKIFLNITPEEQRKRFIERLTNPYKQWKLTSDDIRNHRRWDDYVEAIEDMFERTSTASAPWTAIPANHKWFARIAALRTITDELAHGLDLTPPKIDPVVEKQANAWLRDGRKKRRKRGKR